MWCSACGQHFDTCLVLRCFSAHKVESLDLERVKKEISSICNGVVSWKGRACYENFRVSRARDSCSDFCWTNAHRHQVVSVHFFVSSAHYAAVISKPKKLFPFFFRWNWRRIVNTTSAFDGVFIEGCYTNHLSLILYFVLFFYSSADFMCFFFLSLIFFQESCWY